MKGSAGIKLLELGIVWRKAFLSGTPVQTIAVNAKMNAQVVSRAIWLAKIPVDLKTTIRDNPEIFTRRILVNGFAAKRSLCERDAFKLLRSEVLRMAREGLGSQPKFPKKETKKKKLDKNTGLTNENLSKVSVTTNIIQAMEVEKTLKDVLGFRCRVAFNETGASEITFNLKNLKDLEAFIEMVTPHTGLY